MGLETIEDFTEKKQWEKIISLVHHKLNEMGIKDIQFTVFKNDGSHAKAKSEASSTYWVFAKDQNRAWVELELKPRTKNKDKCSQCDFYEYIKKNYERLTHNNKSVVWDDDDRRKYQRKSGSMDFRIKIYLKNYTFSNSNNDKWASTMVDFVKDFGPIIHSYNSD